MCQLDSKLICKICGVKCKHLISLQSHMKKKHNCTDEDLKNYYLKYLIPDDFDIKCPMNKKGCKGERRFKSFKHGFKSSCANNACSSAKGLLDKYGVENCSQLDWVHEKKKATCRKNNGTDYPLQSKKVYEGMQKTLQETRGVDNIFQDKDIIKGIKEKNSAWSPEARTKRAKTNEEKYDNVCSLHGKDVQKKLRSDYKEKHGVDHWMKRKEIKDKQSNTYEKKTGYKYPMQNPEVIELSKNTLQKRYNADHPMHVKGFWLKMRISRKKNSCLKIDNFLERVGLERMSDYNGIFEILKLKCLRCKEIFEVNYANVYQGCGRCPKCYPKKQGFSIGEIELSDYIESLNFNIKRNNRDLIKKELDIIIEDKKMAIEYCGLYWHSVDGKNLLTTKNKKYHLDKLKKCTESGYKLITIFEDEWKLKQDIVKIRLKHILGVNNDLIKLRASECEIREIDSKIKNEFLEKYHIQGKDVSRIKLGIYYKDELVSVMTFGLPSPAKGAKNSQEGIWELNRFCSHPDYHIYGISSKLLKHFKESFAWEEIFSYADRRWSDGNLYKQLGFNLVGTTNPNYWYWGKDIIGRAHRFNFRKSKLKNMKSYDPNKTEFQIMGLEGYNWIYDCGNLKFVLNR